MHVANVCLLDQLMFDNAMSLYTHSSTLREVDVGLQRGKTCML